MKQVEIAIIGAGPGGIAAAIQLKRCGYNPILFEAEKVGGLLWNANLVENYPGFPTGISGPGLIKLMIEHLNNLKVEISFDAIDCVKSNGKGSFEIFAKKQGNFISNYLIISSGTRPKKLPEKFDEKEELRSNIHRDIRNILNMDGKRIVIIGNGDAAFDHALNLSKRNEITILIRNLNYNGLKLLESRVATNSRITVHNSISVKAITKVGDSHFILKCLKDLEEIDIESDEIVFSIGREPNIDFYKEEKILNNCFLVGDVKNGLYRQAAIAVGDGIRTAMEIDQLIKSRDS